MRCVGIVLVFFLVVCGCGGDDPPREGDSPPPTSPAETNGPARVALQLTAWPRIFDGPLGDEVTASEARDLLGLTAEPEVLTSDYSESWRYRWRGEDGKRREIILDRMPLTDPPMIQGNANGYRAASEEGRDDLVDLGEPGVWAFWRVERGKGRLLVFTRTGVFTIGVSGIPLEKAKGAAVTVARHLFDTNR